MYRGFYKKHLDFLCKLKRKLQEIENVEKNDNIEKNEKDSVKSESIFPSAKDTLEKSKQNWKQVTAEEILKKIQYESSKGNRKAGLFDCYISAELLKELRAKGYRVEVHPLPSTIGPYFEIYW